MPGDRRQGNGLNGFLNTAKSVWPVVAVLIAGVAGFTTLEITVAALADDAEDREKKIERNQHAITDIKIQTAVQTSRDEGIKDDIKEIKDVIKDIYKALKEAGATE